MPSGAKHFSNRVKNGDPSIARRQRNFGRAIGAHFGQFAPLETLRLRATQPNRVSFVRAQKRAIERKVDRRFRIERRDPPTVAFAPRENRHFANFRRRQNARFVPHRWQPFQHIERGPRRRVVQQKFGMFGDDLKRRGENNRARQLVRPRRRAGIGVADGRVIAVPGTQNA